MQTTWLNRCEGDSHSCVLPRISHPSYSTEVPAGMRDVQSDLGALCVRSHCFDIAPQQVHVLDVSRYRRSSVLELHMYDKGVL